MTITTVKTNINLTGVRFRPSKCFGLSMEWESYGDENALKYYDFTFILPFSFLHVNFQTKEQ